MARTASQATSRWIVAGILLAIPLSATPAAPPQGPSQEGAPSGLPLPHDLPLDDHERVLYRFLFKRTYASSPYSWVQDKEIRDTGPFIGGLYYAPPGGPHLLLAGGHELAQGWSPG